MFNALKYIKKLEAVGFPREQAEVQVQLVLDSIGQEVATKSDLADVRNEMADLRADMADLRTEMADLRTELKIEMAGLRTELKTEMADFRSEIKTTLAHLKTDLLIKLGGMMIGTMTVFTALIGVLVKS